MTRESLPKIIQGGMGVGVSSWRLARAVSEAGQLGVVSGTALDVILARRLQLGDPDGHIRRALDHFPFPDIAQRILRRYFIPGGKPCADAFRSTPRPNENWSRLGQELLVAGNFVEVYLAKENHDHPVGINYLEKIQLPTLPSLFGAMMAGVDWVLMGAGIPRAIPGQLDRLAAGKSARLKLEVKGADRSDEFLTNFEPQEFCTGQVPRLKRPRFMAIISSATLGTMLVKKSTGRVDGLVVEGPSAGGHNAPPRGPCRLSERGEPIYGDRDIPDLETLRALGVPFWLAGSCATPERLVQALEVGAAGVQVGTAFAYCTESDLRPDLKRTVLENVATGTIDVITDPLASPTGFPFKVVKEEGREGEDGIGSADVFEDQYISSGGQMVELMLGHDRFCCDLRPLFYRIRERQGAGAARGVECHPYDLAGVLVAKQAGILLTDGFDHPLDCPLNVHQGIHWCGYANETLRRQIAPVIREWLVHHGITGP